MAARFAVTTCTLIGLYALWTAYFTYDNLRDELTAFMRHEASELALNIAETDGSPESIARCVRNIALVTRQHPCAFRVRDASGDLVAEAGPRHILGRVEQPIAVSDPWRARLFSDKIAVHAETLGGRRGTVEIIVGPQAMVEAFREYALFAFFAFLVSVVLAGLSGWFTAHRGLRGLREVVSHAHDVQAPLDAAPIGIAQDAPREVREVASAMNEMLERIQTGLRRMQTFTAGLAHELRSPLQNLIGETEVNLLRERTAGEYQHLLRSNLEDLQELSDAVDNLVTYCRTCEAPERDLHSEQFDLAREVELRLARERRTTERQGVDVRVESAGHTRLTADREGCLRVVRNLVGNAIAWSPRDSVVRVRIEGHDDSVILEVTDQGPGVSAELGERIFEPFVTGRQAAGKRGSYGLGLAICRSVMEQHRGTLAFENLPEGGARFVATFPRDPGTQRPEPGKRAFALS
jgi:two-component system heavy metal sensor histidine kinase CusS